LLKSERDGSGSGLVDDVHHLDPRDVAGVLRRFAADFVKIRGNRDNAFLNRANLLLGIETELVEHPGLQRLWRILPPAEKLVIEAVP
jgi:hypothetical protein